jgi:hypothetical protein
MKILSSYIPFEGKGQENLQNEQKYGECFNKPQTYNVSCLHKRSNSNAFANQHL